MEPRWKAFCDDEVTDDLYPTQEELDNKFEWKSTFANYLPKDEIEFKLDTMWRKFR